VSSAASQRDAERRRFRRFIGVSAACHVLAAAMLGFAPSRDLPVLPPVISVDLLAALPAPQAPPAPPPAPAKPTPKAVVKPPPVAPKPKKIVLPKKAPAAKRPPKKVDRPPPKRPKPKELDYTDAMDKLREELGEPEPTTDQELLASAEPAAQPAASTGARVPPEVARWLAAMKSHVRARWVTPPEFLDRDLVTLLAVELSADGRVIGQPRVVVPSGDPFWDDSAVRAILRASPLPAPPQAGEWPFSFHSQENF
jgi:protein TonB